MPLDLSVVIPTLNEKDNIAPLVSKLTEALESLEWEVIFVDDASSDGTPDAVIDMARDNPRVRIIERIGRRGLSSACIEGMMSSTATYVAVMDADMQHDEKILPRMISELKENPDLELVIGSRFVEGGGVGDWSRFRLWGSYFAKRLGKLVLPGNVSDPMSGYFMADRKFIRTNVVNMSGRGFKILLDLLSVASNDCSFKEVPYVFRSRVYGSSKLSSLVMYEYVLLIVDRLIGNVIPVRFLMFAGVGSIGLLLHFLVLSLFYLVAGVNFWISQTVAASLAMTINFLLNNIFTYNDQKLRGGQVVFGLVKFYLFCSVGLIINLRVAVFLIDYGVPWWFTGLLGAGIGSVWNYAINSTFNWRVKESSL